MEPNQKNSKPAATLVYVPGGKVPAEAYVPILKAIQKELETNKVALSCIIVRYPRILNYDVNAFWGVEWMIFLGLFMRRLTSNHAPIFIGGHSFGAILAQSVAFRTETVFRYSGVLLHSAYIEGKYRGEPIPVPTLTLSGTRDGLTPIHSCGQAVRRPWRARLLSGLDSNRSR